MSDDANDTLTTMEAKVLCLRYGVDNIDQLGNQQSDTEHIRQGISLNVVARQLDEDINILKERELTALRKINDQK